MKLFHFIGCFLGNIIGNLFLGSEGSAISGVNLVLLGIVLFVVLFLFSILRFRLQKTYGARFVFFMGLSLSFSLGFFMFFVKQNGSYFFVLLFGLNLLFFYVTSEEITSYPGPSGPSSSQSWTEFDINVIMEPWPTEDTAVNQPEAGPVPLANEAPEGIRHNNSFESSMQNRIRILEQQNSIFISEEKGAYWNEVKRNLEQAPTQREYNRILDFENRDLQRHECYSILTFILLKNPDLAQNAAYNPKEAFLDFLEEKRDELQLDNHLLPVAERDRREIEFLRQVSQDMIERGRDSIYIGMLCNH